MNTATSQTVISAEETLTIDQFVASLDGNGRAFLCCMDSLERHEDGTMRVPAKFASVKFFRRAIKAKLLRPMGRNPYGVDGMVWAVASHALRMALAAMAATPQA